MRVLALIPARGGSLGIPRKNLTPVGGRPLIQWSIEAGLAAAGVDRVVVSTDDDEIAELAQASGAEVPFRRPDDLAGPTVTDLPVFQHAVRWLEQQEGYRPDLVVHLRPTSPARRPGLVDDAVDRLVATPEATSLRSVSPAPHTPWKMWEIDASGLLHPLLGTFEEEQFNQPRQALPPAWLHNGVIDVVRTEVLQAGSMTGTRIVAFPLALEEAIDIDGPEDLAAAASALAALRASAQVDGGASSSQ